MYSYLLIIKTGAFDAIDAMVNRELTTRFGPDVHYRTLERLTNEVVVIVSYDSRRGLQGILGDWFIEGNHHRETDTEYSTYPVGTLLHYRHILPGEAIHPDNQGA